MSKTVALDQTNVFVRIRMITDATGVPVTVTAATTGHVMWYHRDGAAVVTDATAAADLASLATAHTDWEFILISDGWHWCAFPDAAFAAGVGQVQCGMSATGITGITETVTIEPLFKFQGQASSVTATTTTFTAGQIPYVGDTIYVSAGTGISQSRLVTAVSGQEATHEAWSVNISASTSTIVLIAGDAYGANTDVASSTLSTVTTSDLGSETTTITTLLPTALTASGNLKASMQEYKDVTLKTAAGTEADPFGPA